MTSSTSVDLSLNHKELVILGEQLIYMCIHTVYINIYTGDCF